MYGKRFLAFVLLLVLLAVGPGLAPAAAFAPPAPVPDEAGEQEAPLGPSSLPASVPSDWWTAVQADLRASEYNVTWQVVGATHASPLQPDVVAAYHAPNRAHNLRTYFTPQGIWVIPRDETAPSWELGIGLPGYAVAGDLVVEDNRVEYRRAGLREWYVNDEAGLACHLALQPPTSNAQPLEAREWRLEVGISTGLVPRLIDETNTVEFLDPAGTAVLRYGPFRAVDAQGHTVPLHLELDSYSLPPAPHSLSLIPSSPATYPLTIQAQLTGLPASPTGLSPYPDWMAQGDQEGASFGASVNTAGDVNGDGYSDVIVGAYFYDNGETNEGTAFVYYGAAVGLSPTPAWTAESDQANAEFGHWVSTAGDVNGDGYSDVIVAARVYSNGQAAEGRTYVYHGSASGLSPTPDWTAESDQEGAFFGESVDTAGDVNGDGYADVIVGAYFYDNGETDEGAAFVYHGSAAGLSPTPVWTAESDQVEACFGISVGTAGDVNGDGYADVIVGAHQYDNGQTNEGRAFLYYGNAGDGLGLVPRQLRTDGLLQIAPLGISDSPSAFQLRLNARMPLGREQVKLQWQAAPLGTPFTATGIISGTSNWVDTQTGGVVIAKNVTGLEAGTPYHWRARLLYRPGNRLGQPASRWIHIPWNGWTETDLRTADGPITGLTAWNDSPTALGDTTTLTATADPVYVTYTWDFGDGTTWPPGSLPLWGEGQGGGKEGEGLITHTYPATGTYIAVVTASNTFEAVTATTVVTVEETISGLLALNDSPTELGWPTTFTATVISGSHVTYAWDFGDGELGVGKLVTHTYSATGSYTALVTAGNDVSLLTATSAVTVYCNPVTLTDFTWTPITPSPGETVAFQAGAAGTPPFTFTWAFGDGSYGSGCETSHAYLLTGTYTVWLTASNACGQQVASDTLVVLDICNPPTNTSFSWQPLLPAAGEVVTLTGFSAGTPPLTFTWAFGDGEAGLGITTTHLFTPAGDYAVVLTVSNACTETVAVTSTLLHVCDPVHGAGFTRQPYTPTVGEPVTFTAQAEGEAPLSYAWELGDGTHASGPVVSHTYGAGGDYAVFLTVTNACGEKVVQRSVHVCAPVSGADFTWQPYSPTAGEPVTLTAQAQGEAPLDYAWELGDGICASGPVISHTYGAGGDYGVALTVTNACGEEVVQRSLHVCAPVSGADFTWQPYSPTAGEPVTLTAQAQGEAPISYTWAFGDGGSGSGITSTHRFTMAGGYTVTLTASNACGAQVVDKRVTVLPRCSPVSGTELAWAPLMPTVGQPATFTATAQGTPEIVFRWAFGDGMTATGAVVEHLYGAAGRYSVTVTATNNCGSDSASQSLTVAPLPPRRIFLPLVTKGYATCFLGPWEEEDNDNASQANGPLCPDLAYQAYPDDTNDYYYVETAAGEVVIEMWDYLPGTGGQMILYDSEEHIIVFDNDPHDGWRIESSLAAGLYYVRIYTAEGYSETDPYRLRVQFPWP